MEDIENNVIEKPKRKKTASSNKEDFKTKNCKVILYSESTKELYVVFNGYGISIKNVESFDGSKNVSVKYTGEIGNADFDCKL